MLDLSKVPEATHAFERPAIYFSESREPKLSHSGGLPPNAPGFDWPTNNGKAMHLLVSLDLSEIPNTLDWLPSEGHLLFFYDYDERSEGHSSEERTGWKVIHLKSPAASSPVPIPDNLDQDYLLPPRSLSFEAGPSLPSYEHPEIEKLELSEQVQESYSDALWWDGEDLGDSGQIGGHPKSADGTFQSLESDAISNGAEWDEIYGAEDKQSFNEKLAAAEKKWGLLLYFSMDDRDECPDAEISFMREYSFWVPFEEARAGNFENVWLRVEYS